jgi:hypothetical protein
VGLLARLPILPEVRAGEVVMMDKLSPSDIAVFRRVEQLVWPTSAGSPSHPRDPEERGKALGRLLVAMLPQLERYEISAAFEGQEVPKARVYIRLLQLALDAPLPVVDAAVAAMDADNLWLALATLKSAGT